LPEEAGEAPVGSERVHSGIDPEIHYERRALPDRTLERGEGVLPLSQRGLKAGDEV
jgi:hypothetical protein